MKGNNKGFTLLEAIIAFALLGLVSLMVLGMITASSNSYRSVSSDLSLQYESQLAMNQLTEYIIDCNGGVAFTDSSGTLAIIRQQEPAAEGEDATYTVDFLRRDSSSQELYYSSAQVEFLGDGTPQCALPAQEYLLASHVETFSAVVSSRKVEVTLSFSLQDKSYTATQTIAMRNAVESGYDYTAVLNAVCGIPEE